MKEKIIVALDVPRLQDTTDLVSALAPYVGYFKIGLELITAEGAPQVVKHIRALGGKVFFDGKFSDIPNTVEGATRAMSQLGVSLFTLHANCGQVSLQKAAAVKGQARALAVTVLTSIDEKESQTLFGAPPSTKVQEWAKMAMQAGIDGIVCSGQELMTLGSELGTLLKVVPGIRPSWAESQDQKRIVTPKEAIQKGATHLVIGRPILQPPKNIGTPVEAVKAILAEL